LVLTIFRFFSGNFCSILTRKEALFVKNVSRETFKPGIFRHIITAESSFRPIFAAESNFLHISTTESNFPHISIAESNFRPIFAVESIFAHISIAESSFRHISARHGVNGGSKPSGPDGFRGGLRGKDVVVRFCGAAVEKGQIDYSALLLLK